MSEREVTTPEVMPNREELAIQTEMPLSRNTVHDARRRGERQRHRTDFYGQNVMVTRNESP